MTGIFFCSLADYVMEIDHGEMRLYGGDYDYYLEKTAVPAT